MLRGVENWVVLNSGRYQLLDLGGTNASPMRRSSVCSASCAAVGRVGKNHRAALDMSHANPT